MTDNASSTYRYVKGNNGFRNVEFAGAGSEHNFSHYSFVDIPNTQNSVATTGMREGKTYRYVKGENGFRNVEFAGAGSEHNFPHYSFANIPENSSIDVASTVASSTASPGRGARAWTGVRNQARQARAKAGEAAEAVRTATAKASETVGQAVAGASSSVRNAGTQAANSIQETGNRLRQSIIDHPLRATVAAGSVGFAGGAVVGASGSESI
jgi:hypothetical protein